MKSVVVTKINYDLHTKFDRLRKVTQSSINLNELVSTKQKFAILKTQLFNPIKRETLGKPSNISKVPCVYTLRCTIGRDNCTFPRSCTDNGKQSAIFQRNFHNEKFPLPPVRPLAPTKRSFPSPLSLSLSLSPS